MAPQPDPDEKITGALSDEDSFGPTPPPPAHPHPDDARRGENIQIEGIDEVVKGDPPAERSAENRMEEGMDDDEDLEDLSVEIPPTRVVKRLMAREQRQPFFEKEIKREHMVAAGVVCCVLLIIVIVLAAGFGTGAFSKSPTTEPAPAPAPQPAPSPNGPVTSIPDGARPAGIASFLGSVNARGTSAFSDLSSPETRSLNWLILDDPLQLNPYASEGGRRLAREPNHADQFRLAQRYALVTLWFSSANNWNDGTGWLDETDECAWFGVVCEAQEVPNAGTQNVVVELQLDDNRVEAIPLDIFMLNQLKILSMSGNRLSGPMPSTLTSMSSLVELYLEDNNLEEDLSSKDFSALQNLEILRLGANSFSGTLPDSLWTLTKLQELTLDNNRLTGSISDQVSNLVNLVVFDVNNNRGPDDSLPAFSGPLPVAFTTLPKLEVLDLGRNKFNGEIPTQYAEFPSLIELNLASNEITGAILTGLGSPALKILRIGFNLFSQAAIPDFIYDLTSLEVLSMDSSGLFGRLDARIGNLQNLRELSLSFNFLNGAIPEEMANLNEMRILAIRNNDFTRELDFVSGMTQLSDLNVAFNGFTSLPDFTSLTALERLQAQRNQFNGASFPAGLTDLAALEYIDLSRSGLVGPIPENIGDLAQLETLLLEDNSLSGGVPEAIGNMGSLITLKLGNNQLEGPIPDSIASAQALEVLELQENRLSGELPFGIGALFNLRTLRLESNRDDAVPGSGISGELPSTVGNFVFLQRFEIHTNSFSGPLPSEIGNLRRLEYFDIEFNNFSGAIPDEIASMESLSRFYLSNNSFSGAMPEGICQLELDQLVPDCDIECSCCTWPDVLGCNA